ncbi:copper transporter [Glycomyces arizonensis]|uniref:copper transporter n=1 Tax=Glycomyces arizonensis TaxID=256035 RepID=UPI0004286515|nr:copper transporter [Glycomyces arizonensis]
MINFRYHLISLTAVFLALTIGLILGTAALNGPAMEAIEATSQSLRDRNNAMRDEIEALQEELQDDQSFASEIAPSYLDGRLTGQKILLVALPGAETEVVDAVEEKLDYAGATSAGRISLLDDFLDPANNDQLADLVDGVTPDTIEAPVTYDGVAAMSAILAAVTTGSFEGAPVEIAAGDITTVTTGLTELGMLTVETEPTGGATGVMLVGGAAAADSDADERNTAVVTIATAFAVDDPTVYAASTSAGEGNPVVALRGDDIEAPVSTVNSVTAPQGQIGAVMALVDLIADSSVHHLGPEGEEGVEGWLPDAA